METLKDEFKRAMFGIYRDAKEQANYTATIFLRMLYERGPMETALYLVNSPKPSDGYTALWERKRLDLTVEAVIIDNPKFHCLFDVETLKNACRRLKEYDYDFKQPDA